MSPGEGEDDVGYDVGAPSSGSRLSHHRHSSLSAPPLPPPDFNPPPDFSSDMPFHGISSPPTASRSSSTSMSYIYDIGQYTSQESPTPPASVQEPTIPTASAPAAAAVASTPPVQTNSSTAAACIAPLPVRPQLRVLQRVSSESVTPQSAHSSVSASSQTATSGASSSEGGEVLAARRDELVNQLLSSTDSGSSSRRESRESSAPSSGSSNETSQGFELHIINPTPPMPPLDLTEDALNRIDAPFPRGMDSSPNGEDVLHAWDSVWPVANASHRINLHPEAISSRFPLAPLSPYVTPDFSPAIVAPPSVSRRPPSPGPLVPGQRTPSPSAPLRLQAPASPRLEAMRDTIGDPHSSTTSPERTLPSQPPGSNTSPPVRIRATHARSSSGNASGSTALSDLEASITRSPPRSPRVGPIAWTAAIDVVRPASPSAGTRLRSRTIEAPLSPGSSRMTLPSSPPSTSISSVLASSRSRGKSVSSYISPLAQSQPPERLPPLASPRQDSPRPSPGPRLMRRLSETATALPTPDVSSPSLTLMALPPAVTSAPDPAGEEILEDLCVDDFNLSPPISRPTNLRRAISDNDARASPLPMGVHRSLSNPTQPDKSPKRPPEAADFRSPTAPGPGLDADTSRIRKSPRREFSGLPSMSLIDSGLPPPIAVAVFEDEEENEVANINVDPSGDELGTHLNVHPWTDDDAGSAIAASLVDEGDMLPSGTFEMDVTFDDEGLNTLERIFLLSRSEYAFHRSYVARVLGDLLGDVDPCESVEYVLPLISGFSMDEDESVKEAFAAELHRILWYFFSTCKLVVNDISADELLEGAADAGSATDTVIITSEGVQIVPLPTLAEVADAEVITERRDSAGTQRSSTASTWTHTGSSGFSSIREVDTPDTSVSSFQDAAINAMVDPIGDKSWTEEEGEGTHVDQPVLTVDFFRPLLGTLLLSQNAAIADPVRNGIIAIIARLRGRGPLDVETWGANVNQPEPEPEERQTFVSQTGPHIHELCSFSPASRLMVENELLHGIVLGMGTLSTDVPDSLFEDGDRSAEQDELARELAKDEELFRAQMLHEATLGRALSLSFIGSVSELYGPDEVVEHGFVDEIIRGLDGDDTTRAEAALAMSLLAKVAPVQHVYRMLPVYGAFANDEFDHVRQSSCLCMPPLCRRIEEPDYRREFAVTAMETYMASNEDVRCAALEMLGEVIHAFVSDPLGPPPELLAMYADDGHTKGTDSDWDIVASFNFPGVCLTLGADRWEELRGLFSRLQARAGDRVLKTIASFLHELARILRPEQVAEDILPVYHRLLECDDDVRERVFEHVDVIVARVPAPHGWACFRDLANAWRENTLGGWRVREQLAHHIPSFVETFSAQHELCAVLEMMRSALLDPFAAVREAATLAVPRAYEMLGDYSAAGNCNDDAVDCGAMCSMTFREILLDLATSSKYRQRLTFVRCLRQFVRRPNNRHTFERYFVPALPRLSNDVVDVRLGLAQVVADLFVNGAFYCYNNTDDPGKVPVPAEIRRLAGALAEDDAVDVREVAQFALSHLELGPDSIAGTELELPPQFRRKDSVSDQLGSMRLEDGSARSSGDHSSLLRAMASPLVTTTPDDPFEASFSRAT